MTVPNDGRAILADPAGLRDLALTEYWAQSLARSQRRRELRRRRTPGGAPASIALSALALSGALTGVAGAQGTTTASAPASDLNLGIGDSGPAVKALQQALGIDSDGEFGPLTLRAVESFQRAHGLPATGHVGPLTTAALSLGATGAAPTTSPKPAASPPAIALSSSAVRAMQRALGVPADGVAGPITRSALRRFEASHGLPADGRPDADSLRALGVDSTAPAPTAAAPVSSGAQGAVAAALAKVGAPYVAGSTGPNGFDCSGLVYYAFRTVGITLPRTSYAMYGTGTSVDRTQIQAGDLVFFNTAGSGASDVGIATGPDSAVSATTHGVMTHSIFDGYWGSHYVGARRVR